MACKDGALDVCFNKFALLAFRASRSLEVRGGGKSESLMIPPLLDMVLSESFLAEE